MFDVQSPCAVWLVYVFQSMLHYSLSLFSLFIEHALLSFSVILSADQESISAQRQRFIIKTPKSLSTLLITCHLHWEKDWIFPREIMLIASLPLSHFLGILLFSRWIRKHLFMVSELSSFLCSGLVKSCTLFTFFFIALCVSETFGVPISLCHALKFRRWFGLFENKKKRSLI